MSTLSDPLISLGSTLNHQLNQIQVHEILSKISRDCRENVPTYGEDGEMLFNSPETAQSKAYSAASEAANGGWWPDRSYTHVEALFKLALKLLASESNSETLNNCVGA